MKRITLLALLVFAVGSAWTNPETDSVTPAEPDETAIAGVVDVRVPDIDGNVHRPGGDSGYRPFALVFLETGCPISRRYLPDLNDIAARAAEHGVKLYGVLSDPSTTPSEARTFRDDYGLQFPVLWDATGDLADRLGPEIVPEVFVIDGADRIVYRGRIDDRFVSPGKLRGTITSHDLLEAINVVADGGRPENRRAQPIGCYFEAWVEADTQNPTYHRNVAPVLEANCAECHTAGGIGPFELRTYEQARRRRGMIAYTVAERIMPPWPAEVGYGHFRDQRTLSDGQIRMLQTWADNGAPEGDAAHALPTRAPADASWRLGDPHQLVEMPMPFDIPAQGDDIYQYFVIRDALDQDRMITGIDFRPGDPSVVHHGIFYVDYSGEARALDESTPGVGFSVFDGGGFMQSENAMAIGGWAPGSDPYSLPDGLAMSLPGGADIVLEIHYHLTGKASRDQSAMALYFAEGEVERTVDALWMSEMNLDIEPGDRRYERHLSLELPVDVQLIDVSPHMHYIGKSAKVVATLPDGTERPLIHIPAWDFRWQNVYTFRQPVELPAGSRIDAWYQWDNSADNPANPSNPPVPVEWGLQSSDEMGELYMTYVADSADDEAEMQAAMLAAAARMMAGDQVSAAAFEGPEAALEALSTMSLWEPAAEAILIGLSDSEYEELVGLAYTAASAWDDADAIALYGGLLAIAAIYSGGSEQEALATESERALDRALELDPDNTEARRAKDAMQGWGAG